jgi:16S rRNA (uracil1498-N3)-methyltransferase
MAKNISSLRRFWIEPEEVSAETFQLKDETFHHAIVVTRLGVGDEFELITGGLEALHVRVDSAQKKSAQVSILGRRALPGPRTPRVHLYFAVPKWPTLDAVVEKCVELGVDTLIPVLSDFSSVRKLEDYSDSRKERLEKIIRAATVQSGRGSLMQLKEPMLYRDVMQTTNLSSSQVGLMAYEGRPAVEIRQELRRLVTAQTEDISILVGAEGGWSEAEVAMARAKQWPVVTMGPQILRAETACLALVSVIKYEAGLMQ